MAVGRRHGGNHRARRERRLWFARCAAATPQCQGHARAVSPEFVDGAPSDRARRRSRRAKIVTNMKIPIIMPQLGESIAEANIINFLVKPGDNVEADQDLIEVETDKATMTVAS